MTASSETTEPGDREGAGEPQDVRVVAFGGGTGLPRLLRGLRHVAGHVTAVVTVADDGGSSGRLRRELDVAPPGDVRNCLVALSNNPLLADVFDHRFCRADGALYAHSVGNLIIAALSELSGEFAAAVDQAARLLDVRSRVLPAATRSVTLVTHYADGRVVRGESAIARTDAAITRVALDPDGVEAPAEVLEAIGAADIVVLAPGSLFTSTIPSLLGAGVADALRRFRGPVIYTANVMAQPTETAGMTLSAHLRAITDHVGPVLTDVIVHSDPLPPARSTEYRAHGSTGVVIDAAAVAELGVALRPACVLADGGRAEIRHDPDRLAQEVLVVARDRSSARSEAAGSARPRAADASMR